MTELRTLTPNEVNIPPVGMLIGTLGRSELEAAAALVVKFQQLQGGDEWVSMRFGDFVEAIKADSDVQQWSKNPFWQPDIPGLLDDWIEGWTLGDLGSMGTVTEKFIEAVSNPRVGPLDQQAVRKWS